MPMPVLVTAIVAPSSGVMDSVRANPEVEPAISVPGMDDHPTAVALFGAIMAALYRRERTGKGGVVSTPLRNTRSAKGKHGRTGKPAR
ncbi:MAG: CoA transferase [Parvibaculum sp.]|nr:CoA transferase [Parvibaculum sp.]